MSATTDAHLCCAVLVEQARHDDEDCRHCLDISYLAVSVTVVLTLCVVRSTGQHLKSGLPKTESL